MIVRNVRKEQLVFSLWTNTVCRLRARATWLVSMPVLCPQSWRMRPAWIHSFTRHLQRNLMKRVPHLTLLTRRTTATARRRSNSRTNHCWWDTIRASHWQSDKHKNEKKRVSLINNQSSIILKSVLITFFSHLLLLLHHVPSILRLLLFPPSTWCTLLRSPFLRRTNHLAYTLHLLSVWEPISPTSHALLLLSAVGGLLNLWGGIKYRCKLWWEVQMLLCHMHFSVCNRCTTTARGGRSIS